MSESPRKPKLLFVCIGNMCRSPMAEGFARHFAGDLADVYSAGTHPTGVVSEDSIEMMDELDIDISRQRSNGLEAVPVSEMDVVVSMAPVPAARMVPPGFKGRTLDWPVPDPIGRSLRVFREVRDDIAQRVSQLLTELGVDHER